MNFISFQFACFFALVFIFYYIIRPGYRYIWLLIASYFFYACWDYKYAAVLLFITVITYFSAVLMKNRHRRAYLWFGIVSSAAVLSFFKFGKLMTSMLADSLNASDESWLRAADIVMPIGISFYVLQAIGYLADVYKGKIDAEKNFARYALFISFFPTVVSGPIERGSNLLVQMRRETAFSYDTAKSGLCMVMWGCCLKVLIADRLFQIVNVAFENYPTQTGALLFGAAILYGIQLYADFSGYSYIAIGLARMLGFDLISNFKQPYFSKNIREFWSRWHISFSSWLRDYIYIPLGGSRCGRFRMYFNLMVTFMISGMWHGAGAKYIVWGGIHGVYQITAKLTEPMRGRIKKCLKIKTECFSYRLFQAIITFALVDCAWIFFGASSFSAAVGILKNIVFNFQLSSTIVNELYLLGCERGMYWLLMVGIAFVIAVDLAHERGVSITKWLSGQNKAFRWTIYIFACLLLIIGLIYNYGLDAFNFIYARF